MANNLIMSLLAQGVGPSLFRENRQQKEREQAQAQASQQSALQDAEARRRLLALQTQQAQAGIENANKSQFKTLQGQDGNQYQVEVSPNGQIVGQPKPLSLGKKPVQIPTGLMEYLPPEKQVSPESVTTQDLFTAAQRRSQEKMKPSLDEQKFQYTKQKDAIKQEEIQNKTQKAQDIAKAKSETIGTTVNEALGILDKAPIATGGFIGGVASNIPGTDSYNLEKTINTIKAVLSFDELQKMREASKTGGALGSVSERELELLGSTVASLDVGLDNEILKKNLEKVRQHYDKFISSLDGKTQNGEPNITTQAEYDALPSGAIYIEDGKKYRKP